MASNTSDRDEYEQLKKTITQKLDHERNVQEQVDELQEQIRKLRRESKRLQWQAESEESATMTALTKYARLDCRKLCDKICQVFPREIRDMVYVHLHGHQDIIVGPSWDARTKSSKKKTLFKWKALDRLHDYFYQLTDSHWWDAEYMSAKVIGEIVESYWRTVHIDFQENWLSIPEFRVTDHLKVGSIPVDFVTNVKVTLDCSEYMPVEEEPKSNPWGNAQAAGLGWGGTSWDTGSESSNEISEHATRFPESRLLADMEKFFGFKQGSKITLNMRAGSSGFKDLFYAMSPIIYPTLKRLSRSGLVVKVVLFRNDSGWDASGKELMLELRGDHADLASFEQEYLREIEIRTQRLDEQRKIDEAEQLEAMLDEAGDISEDEEVDLVDLNQGGSGG